jgi:hypothetical protein
VVQRIVGVVQTAQHNNCMRGLIARIGGQLTTCSVEKISVTVWDGTPGAGAGVERGVGRDVVGRSGVAG